MIKNIILKLSIFLLILCVMDSCCIFRSKKRVKDPKRFEFVQFFVEHPELQDSIVSNNKYSYPLYANEGYWKLIKKAIKEAFYCGFDFVDDEEFLSISENKKFIPGQRIVIRSKCIETQDLIFEFELSEDKKTWNFTYIYFTNFIE